MPKGEKGDQGQAGRDGVTPTVTVKIIKKTVLTLSINDGEGNVTSTVVRMVLIEQPMVTQEMKPNKTTTVIFYYDQK